MKTAILSLMLFLLTMTIFAQQPEWEWAQQITYPADWKMALDVESNIYMTGEFDSTAVFGSTILTCKGTRDCFVAKMSKDGKWLWAVQTDNTTDVKGNCIDVDASGNIIISGTFTGKCKFGNTTLTCTGEADIFVAKLDNKGNWLWATQTGGDSYAGVLYLKTDAQENIFISGKFQAIAAFGDTILYSLPTCFISKLDTNGKWLWSKKISSKSDIPHPISLDKYGNMYFSGNFSGNVTVADSMLACSGLFNSFVAKLDANGKLQWLARNVGRYGTTVWSIATDAEGNSYITGNGTQDVEFGKYRVDCGLINIFVAKLDSNGNWLWVRKADSKDYQFATCVSLDNAGNPVITGNFSGKTRLGSFKLQKSGDWDMLVASLSKKGKWLWAIQAGGKSNAEGHTLLIDKDNNAFIAGLYYSDDMILGKQILRLSGHDTDNFIAKLKLSSTVTLGYPDK